MDWSDTAASVATKHRAPARRDPCTPTLQQEARFDDFLDCYNRERPHQALDMRYPAELYAPSPRP